MQIELKRLQAETGITFVFVTHDQEEALTMSDRIAVMSQGQVRQVGTAREIYDRPADRFVADFIGETNFLEATLVESEGASAAVRLKAGGTIRAGLPEGGAPKSELTVVVRPEHADLVAAGDGTFDGTLGEVIYFGTDTHFHVRLDDGGTFIVRRQNSRSGAAAPETGARVGVRLGESAAQILKD